MNALQANGIAMHYRADIRDPEWLTFVFINSLGTDFRIWDGVANAIDGRYNLIRHDKRGHGLTELGDAPARIATYAGDVESLIAQLGVKKLILCGLSVGGLIAQHLMLNGQLDIRGAVLSNTGLKVGTQESWNARIAAITSSGIGSIAGAVIERWLSPEFRAAQPTVTSLCRSMLTRTPAEGYIACCKAIRDAPPFDHGHAQKRVPALCISGAHDGATPPALVKDLAQALPGARYHEFVDAGHLPCIEHPERYAALITEFADGM